MDLGQNSRGKKPKEVVLKLDKSNVKKGGALVGKLLSGKNMNRATVISMIKKGWQMEKGGVEIHELNLIKPIFLFRFDKEEDYNRVIRGRPWSILGNLLNLQPWDDYMVLSEVNFQYCPFWVQFHELPLDAFDYENAVTLGEAVGEVVMFENPVLNGQMTRSFIRVRCLINLEEPLTRGFWVPREEKDPAWVIVKYERLQNYCYRCRRIGHENKNCSEPEYSNKSRIKFK